MKATLIGNGRWGKILTPYIAQAFDLVHVYGRDYPYNIDTDVVFVATPHYAHYDVVKHLLLQGKHVFCEKPLTLQSELCMELKQIADEQGVILYTDYLEMVTPSKIKMQELAGHIGDIIFIEGIFLKYNGKDNIDKTWGLYPHLLSIVSLFVDINSLTYYTEDKFLYAFNDDVIISLMANIKSEVIRKQIILTGQKGLIWWDAYAYNTLTLCNDTREVWHYDEKNNIMYSINKFIDIINGKCKNNIDIAISITKICEAIKKKGWYNCEQ